MYKAGKAARAEQLASFISSSGINIERADWNRLLSMMNSAQGVIAKADGTRVHVTMKVELVGKREEKPPAILSYPLTIECGTEDNAERVAEVMNGKSSSGDRDNPPA